MTPKSLSRKRRAAGKARWAQATEAERQQLREIARARAAEVGKLGGRPRSPDRCACGLMTAKRAKARGHKC